MNIQGKIKKFLKQFLYEMIIIDIENLHINVVDEKISLRNNAFDFGISIKNI